MVSLKNQIKVITKYLFFQIAIIMFHSLLLLFLIIIISSFTVLLSNSFAEPVKAELYHLMMEY
jgi:hypothetical protein